MKIEQFIKAIEQEPNCATCRFFTPGSNGFVFRDGRFLETLGRCRRYPPVVTRNEEGREGEYPPEFAHPPIKVLVGESGDGEIWICSDCTSGFSEEDTPWCGEYRKYAHRYEILEKDE